MGNFSAEKLAIPEVLLVKARKFADLRGFFSETYVAAAYADMGIACDFVQDNQAYSARPGTIRGLHFQLPPQAQAKLVRVVRGAIFDVVVDLRRDSPTYGRWCSATLSAEGGEQIFIPRGFAHGLCTLEPDTIVIYKVDGYYSAEHDAGIAWDDPDIAVDWPIDHGAIIASDKDRALLSFRDFSSPFVA